MNRKHLITLCLCFVLIVFQNVHGQNSQSGEFPYWWQVELRVAMSGDYSYRKDNKGFDGNYSFSTLLLGSIQDDEGGDYVFLQVHQEVKDVRWKEVLFIEAKRIESNLNDLSGKVVPELTINYIFHNKGSLLLDFEYNALQVPFIGTGGTNSAELILPGVVHMLHLPVSAGDESIGNKGKYDKGVILGSNRVTFTVKELTANPLVTKSYEWTWRDKSGSTWKSRHTVKITLKMARKLKTEVI